MNSSGVIVRFLSLLDVALILLGVLMLALMQTSVSSEQQTNASESKDVSAISQVNFIYLYAGWKGEQKGHCYLLGQDMKINRKVSTTSNEEIQAIIDERQDTDKSTDVVMLLFDSDGWFASWPDSKINDLEDAWGVKVVPIYNVSIDP